jgi:hypothetical protein
MKRAPSLFFAAALLAACSDDQPTPFTEVDAGGPDSGLPTSDVAVDARPDRSTPDVVDLTDVPPPDAPAPSDVACTATLAGTVRFGMVGGLVATSETFTLTPPLAFRAERRGATGMTTSCQTSVPGCNTTDMVDVGEVNAALSARDVQTAFGMARGGMMLVYGVDPRPMDGQVFSVALDGAEVIVGGPCRTGGGGCLEIPIGLQRLVDVLTGLRDQELLRPACMGLRTM